jgi:predicted secreted protein
MLLVGWAGAAQLDLTEAENGKDILLNRGDMLLVHLPSNRTTGYGWSVVNSKPGKLEEPGEPTLKPLKSARGLVGAGSVETWTFRAATAGRTTLTFSYARPWEKGVSPIRVIAWPVTVRN